LLWYRHSSSHHPILFGLRIVSPPVAVEGNTLGHGDEAVSLHVLTVLEARLLKPAGVLAIGGLVENKDGLLVVYVTRWKDNLEVVVPSGDETRFDITLVAPDKRFDRVLSLFQYDTVIDITKEQLHHTNIESIVDREDHVHQITPVTIRGKMSRL
jgi:hypothetical protein